MEPSEGLGLKRLGDVIKLEYGKPLPKNLRNIKGKYPAYGANGVKERTNKYYYDKPSIIVGRKGSAGIVTLTEQKFWPLDVTYFVTFDEKKYDLMFLFYLLSKLNLPSLAKGVKPGVNRNEVYNIEVKIPPLPEQKRIVAILDEAFAALETAKKNTEKNLENAQELFDSYMKTVFSDARISFSEKRLGDFLEIQRGGSPRPIKSFLTKSTDGINWIKIGDASESEKYIYKTKEKIKPEGVSKSRMVHEGDFLLSNSMSFGRPYILKTSGCIHDGWLVLRPNKEEVFSDYLYYVLGSKFVYYQFDRLAAGSTVRNLNISLVSQVIVPLPPLMQQKEIVQMFETFYEHIYNYKKSTEQKKEHFEELRNALLQKAFSGELGVSA